MRYLAGFWLVCLFMSGVVSAQTGVEACDLTADINSYLTDGQNALLSSDFEAALESFTCAVQIDFNNPAGYTGRAEAYAGLERYIEARSDLLSVLAINRDLHMPPAAEATPDPDQPEAPVIDEAPIVSRIEEIEAQIMPVELDTFASSGRDQFGVNFPLEPLMDFTQTSSLETLTLLNDAGIYTQNGVMLDNRDVLMIFEIGDPQIIAGMPLDSALVDVAQGLRTITEGEPTPLTRISTTGFSGYTFTVMTNRDDPQRVLVFDLDPSNTGVFILKVTLTTANEEDFEASLPLLLTITDSVQLFTPLTTQSGGDDAAFRNEGDGLTFPLPDGWTAEATVVNGRDALAITTDGGAYTPDVAPVAGAPYALLSYGSASELLGFEAGTLDVENAPVQVIDALTGITQGARPLPYEGFNAGLAFTSDGTTDRFIFAVLLDDDFYVLADMFAAAGSGGDFFEALMMLVTQVGFSN